MKKTTPNRSSKGTFAKGGTGGAGRKKGSRSLAIEIIFRLFAEQAKQFEEFMRLRVEEDPIAFYKEFVEPLQPNETKIISEEGDAPIRIEVTTKVTKPIGKNKR